MVILGISCFYHDSAASFISGEKILFAAEEERFSRIKHDSSFPINSIRLGMEYLKISCKDISAIVYYEKPFLKFDRLVETWIKSGFAGYNFFMKSAPVWFSDKLFAKYHIKSQLKSLGNFSEEVINNIYFSDHHQSHAASAFYPSPYNDAAIITIDGVGEYSTTSISWGHNNKITLLRDIKFPHSLGLLYSAFTAYCGFRVNSGEYKLMGLAPYGNPKYTDLILNNLIQLYDDGSYRLNMKFFDLSATKQFYNPHFCNLFGCSSLKVDNVPNQFYMDLAASIQKVIEYAVIRLAKTAKNIINSDNLCLAGGVALNCVANGELLRSSLYKNIWIQPASSDSGGSLGAAFSYYYHALNKSRSMKFSDSMNGSLLGRSFDRNEIKNELNRLGAKYEIFDLSEGIKFIVHSIAEGSVVGWFSGRAEFGPRALGSRSILADPRNKIMQKKLNLKIKYRESFRPFAPSILEEYLTDWFNLETKSPYMLMTALVNDSKLVYNAENTVNCGISRINQIRSVIPAVTHIDNSARIQTVGKDANPIFRMLLEQFYSYTGVPILINTSFNVRGEPIVESVSDAYRCFMRSDMDYLYIDGFILNKAQQPIEFNIKKDALGLD